MKGITIHTEAEFELLESVAFYEGRKQGLGLEFERAARTVVAGIPANPKQYPVEVDGTRRAPLRRFPFVVRFVDLPDTIWIVAFAHTSRKPGYWRERLQ